MPWTNPKVQKNRLEGIEWGSLKDYSFIQGDSSYFQNQSKITNNGRALFWALAWSFRVVESGKNFVEFVNSL